MIIIDGNHLTIQDVVQVARGNAPVQLAPESVHVIQESRQRVEKIIAAGDPVYGINTGFGIFANRQISRSDSQHLSRNLILSHAVGTGPPLPNDVVRAAMLIRANTLAKGHSGVRLVLVENLLKMLNRGVTPEIPSQGSLGSSGDLAPLSHLALVLSRGEEDLEQVSGWANYQGQRLSGKQAMKRADLPRLVLQAKEGLALSNGATFSAAVGALACADSRRLLDISEVSLSLSLEALLGASCAFHPQIHEARQHPGQIKVAAAVRELTEGSTLIDSTDRVQDAYSLRCAPQVHGPVRETLEFAERLITREINAATDNPLLFSDGKAISGGNFHGEGIGLVLDYLGIALTELGGIAERRIFRLTDGTLNADLPPMLVNTNRDAGLNSGVMMLQYTAASLVLENRSLASPDSTHSLPTSAEQEDHNANSMTAARHTLQISRNTAHILAVELYTAARALDLRLRSLPEAEPGVGTAAAQALIRREVPYQAGDAWWGPEVDSVRKLIMKDEFLRVIRDALTGS